MYSDKNIMTVQVKSALVFLFCFFLFLFLSLVLDFPLFLFRRRQLWLRAWSGTGSWRFTTIAMPARRTYTITNACVSPAFQPEIRGLGIPD